MGGKEFYAGEDRRVEIGVGGGGRELECVLPVVDGDMMTTDVALARLSRVDYQV